MNDRILLRASVAGIAAAALCCFTPLLVGVLGALGLSAWLGRLDFVLLSALAIFAGITVYALYRRGCAAGAARAAAGGASPTREVHR